MLIFNTTFLVSDNLQQLWLQWVHNQHIPFMLASDMFAKPQVAKVLSNEQQEGISYSVQFQVNDMATLQQWHREYAEAFKRDFSRRFGTDALFFTTVLELIE